MNNGEFKNSRKHVVCFPNTLQPDTKTFKIKIMQKHGVHSQSRKFVCYSLWGSRAIYHKGAFANAVLIPKIYGKDWTVRVYVARDVPQKVIDRLLKLKAEVFVMNTNSSEAGSLGAFWRFLSFSESGVTILTRDLDSRPTHREFLAVKDWLDSGLPFHRIYDSNMDNFNAIDPSLFRGKPCIVPFFAGLFGVRNPFEGKPLIRNILKLVDKYKYKSAYGGEEKFLADVILPVAQINGVFTSIMKGHNPKQAKLFLRGRKHSWSYLIDIPVNKQSMLKYQVHAEYYPSNKNAPVSASKFIKTFKKDKIIFGP